jgi:CRISPR-associated protein Csx3
VDNTDDTTKDILSLESLPAILIGGPPHSGKSVLTYNLTMQLRRRNVDHYVFRATGDIDGDWRNDWYLKALAQDARETLNQIIGQVKQFRTEWSPEFLDLVCRDLSARRHLPLIVDIGGVPKDQDSCISQTCTASILLIKDEDSLPEGKEKEDAKKYNQRWRHFITTYGPRPLAELRSVQHGESFLTSSPDAPVITGTIAGLEPEVRLHEDNKVFKALIKRISKLFKYPEGVLEKKHLSDPRLKDVNLVVNLPRELQAFASEWALPDNPDPDNWLPDMLEPLLDRLPSDRAMAVYGRGPHWLYGVLALHARTQPFHQFDARLGWTEPPLIRAGTPNSYTEEFLYINGKQDDDFYQILIHPRYNYLDRRDADQLTFPEPPRDKGVIVTGQLPLWLFTALARFYAQQNVPWIALNDAGDNMPVVIYSQVASHSIGEVLANL